MNVGRHPTGFAKLAWNVLKLTNMYAAKKKFDISGAIAFNSPIKMNLQMESVIQSIGKFGKKEKNRETILTLWK